MLAYVWDVFCQDYLRVMLISLFGQWIGLGIADVLLVRRQSMWKIGFFMALKLFLGVLLVDVVLPYQFAESELLPVLRLITSASSSLVGIFLFYYAFHGGFVKSVVGMMISEILISCILLPATVIVNLAQGRPDIYLFGGRLMVTDLVILLLMLLFYRFLMHFLRSYLQRFRTCQIKYEQFWITVLVIWAISMQGMSVEGVSDNDRFLFTMYVMFLILGAGGTFVLFLIYLSYRKRTRVERELLNTQMQLMATHYHSFQTQMQQMQACQNLIDEQMKEIEGRTPGKDVKERFSQYLENLQEAYSQIHMSVYCSDWMTDAVLYCQTDVARQQGIEVTCSIQGYDKEEVPGTCLAQILYELFDFALIQHMEQQWINSQKKSDGSRHSTKDSETPCIQVKTGRAANQFVIQFSTNIGKRRKLPLHSLKDCVRPYDGMVTVLEEELLTVSITLPLRRSALKEEL